MTKFLLSDKHFYRQKTFCRLFFLSSKKPFPISNELIAFFHSFKKWYYFGTIAAANRKTYEHFAEITFFRKLFFTVFDPFTSIFSRNTKKPGNNEKKKVIHKMKETLK